MHPICASCGIEIRWEPTVSGKSLYCCTGCAAGGPCTCDYGLLRQQQDRAALAVYRQQHILPRDPKREAGRGTPQ